MTRQDANLGVLGPVDYVVVEFPADDADFSGEMAAELTSLIDRGLVRALDLLVVRKDRDGSVSVDELHAPDPTDLAQLLALDGDLAVLLAEQDVAEIGAVLEPGAVAAVLVYENRWAGPFLSAVRRSGGRLAVHGRIPAQTLPAAIGAEPPTGTGRQSLTSRSAGDALADPDDRGPRRSP